METPTHPPSRSHLQANSNKVFGCFFRLWFWGFQMTSNLIRSCDLGMVIGRPFCLVQSFKDWFFAVVFLGVAFYYSIVSHRDLWDGRYIYSYIYRFSKKCRYKYTFRPMDANENPWPGLGGGDLSTWLRFKRNLFNRKLVIEMAHLFWEGGLLRIARILGWTHGSDRNDR